MSQDATSTDHAEPRVYEPGAARKDDRGASAATTPDRISDDVLDLLADLIVARIRPVDDGGTQ